MTGEDKQATSTLSVLAVIVKKNAEVKRRGVATRKFYLSAFEALLRRELWLEITWQ